MTKQTGPTVINYIRTKNCNRGTAMEHPAEKNNNNNNNKTLFSGFKLLFLCLVSLILISSSFWCVGKSWLRECGLCWQISFLVLVHRNFDLNSDAAPHCKICVYSAEEWNTSATALYLEIYVTVNIHYSENQGVLCFHVFIVNKA